MKPRPYQQAGIDAVLEKFAEGSSTLVSWATGLGKTVLFAHVMGRILQQQPGARCGLLHHRRELGEQAAKKIQRITNQPIEFDQAEQYADRYQHGLLKWKAPIVIMSVQTQVARHGDGFRMDRFDPNDFNLLVIDEAHHATSDTYKAVIEHYQQNPDLKLLGVTATPNRHDEKSLGQIFGSDVAEMGILDGIMDGWLVEPNTQAVYVGSMDLSSVKSTAGDLNGKELAAVMEQEPVLHGVVYPTIKAAGDRKTLVFTASVAHAELASEIFNRHRSGCSRIVHGKTPSDLRDRIIADFRANEFQYLCNCGIASEGFDVDDIGCVAIARPTKSRPLYQQMAGRGTRVLESLNIDQYERSDDRLEAIAGSAKPNLLLLDFVGNSGKHKLMSAVDMLGGNYSDDVLAIARDALRHADRTQNVREALSEAEKREVEQSRIKRDADTVEQQRRRRGFRPEVEFGMKEVNPFDVFDVSVRREPGWNKDRLPTGPQIAALERFKVSNPGRYTFTAASQLLDQLIGRMKADRCTFKQAAVLKRHGFPIDCTIKEATGQIGKIAQAGWKLYGPEKRRTKPVVKCPVL